MINKMSNINIITSLMKNALESILLVNTIEPSYYLDAFLHRKLYSITRRKPERGQDSSKPVTATCCRNIMLSDKVEIT